MRLNLLFRQQPVHIRHPPLRPLKVLRTVLFRQGPLIYWFAKRVVAQAVAILHVLTLQCAIMKKIAIAASGRKNLGAEIPRGRRGDGVPDVMQVVVGRGADLGRALGVVVVEGLDGAERLDESKVARRARRDDSIAGPVDTKWISSLVIFPLAPHTLATASVMKRKHSQSRKLNPQTARRATPTINQHRLSFTLPLTRPSQPHLLNQALATGNHANAQRGRLLKPHAVRNAHLDVSPRNNLLGERTVLGLQLVPAVDEAADAVANAPGSIVAGAGLCDDAGVLGTSQRWD